MAASNSKPGPSFRKFLIDDDEECTSILQLPSQFVKSYGDVLPPNATLKIDKSEKCWRVGIEKFHDRYFFTDGWNKFAQDVDLKSLEYLSFNFVGLSAAIHVENNGCRELFYDGFTDEEEGSGVGKIWSFVKEVKIHDANRLGIPVNFAIGTGIATNRKVQLQDAKGRKWPVCVTDGRRGQFAISAGWRDFLIGNNVLVGSTISFEFVSSFDNTIEARVIKEGTNANALFKYVKRKGKGKRKFQLFTSDKTSDLNVESENEERFMEQGDDTDVCKRWIFSKEFKKNHFRCRMNIPKDFAIGTGIGRSRDIQVHDEKGKNWTVRVTDRKCGRFAMTAGLKDFLVGNKVVIGCTVSFEYVPTSSDYTIEARVTKRGRGRPPSLVSMS
ncbi:hypothetical protein ACJIZ3_008126 [Penstemon smallii]|uniref:TF-B3 domain-containing protein n=1 Tax=Penstemon smallii TaxID=265156 RepID=A0ABD3T8V6_9LAMI